ncbi:hypothetical protein CCHR01_19715 [Colletotrichum chrysophilum]|uniref:Uncharacterized protein n=1 Tax=Colletotrichum chrysophilum TaxID=1836956 RepID=A0AAD9EA59_9PEZI|nr:hypothetical protein CCHR01_19715 [Colletotrichum chrysophilum]
MHPPSVTFTLSVSLPVSARDSSLAPGQLAPCLCPPFALCLLSLSSSPSIRLSGSPTPTPTPLPSLSMYGPLSLRLEAPQSFPSPTPTGRHSTPALFGLGPPGRRVREPGKANSPSAAGSELRPLPISLQRHSPYLRHGAIPSCLKSPQAHVSQLRVHQLMDVGTHVPLNHAGGLGSQGMSPRGVKKEK